MRRCVLVVVVTACLDLGLTYATVAADMPVKAPIAPPMAPPPYDWSGPYLGARELDLITVAGKTEEPVRIYEATGRTGELTPEQSELRDQFGRGLAVYRRQDWDEAQTEFEGCLRTLEEDGPTHLFLERIGLLRSTPPPADWNGIWHLSEK